VASGIVLNLPFEPLTSGFDPRRLLGKRERAASCRIAAVIAVAGTRGVRLGGRGLPAGFVCQHVGREACDHPRELADIGGIAANAAHHQVASSPARANAPSGLSARPATEGFALLVFGRSRDVGTVVIGVFGVARLSAHERPFVPVKLADGGGSRGCWSATGTVDTAGIPSR
jgi:hypothetical protein